MKNFRNEQNTHTRGGVKNCVFRHCERSEAIQSAGYHWIASGYRPRNDGAAHFSHSLTRNGERFLLLALLFALSALSVSAQKSQKTQNEFSIYGGGGWAAFYFQPSVKNASSMGYGVDIGGGFTGFLSPNWGLHVGAGFGLFNVKNKVNGFAFVTPEQTDCEGYRYDLHTAFNEYQETHQAVFLSVPLMLQFQTNMRHSHWRKNKKAGYYAMAGAKAQLLLDYNYTAELASLNKMAYYPEFDNWIIHQPALGLGVFNGINASGKMKFDILAMLAFETGAKWRIDRNLFLYTGVYLDYGLTDPTQKTRTPYRDYNTSEKNTDLALLKFTDRTNLMAAGIKLRLAFLQSPKKGCFY